jgi:coenzyme F420-0:L-glutamate ligase / coenzyme F420-1:gamma-L-glutamate ligase
MTESRRAAGQPLGAITLLPLTGLPEVQGGDDLARHLLDALAASGLQLQNGDILVLAQKIVSKAEGRLVRLAAVTPSPEAERVAAIIEKDPRLVELILQESEGISRMRRGVLIVRHRLGFTSANAGIDRSNVPQAEDEPAVLLLPADPDRSAAALRAVLCAATGASVAVVISDSHGRPFRLGTVGVAIGASGLPALWNRRGDPDRQGYQLRHTEVALADEIAAAAGLLMGQAAEGVPAVVVRGLQLPPGEGSAQDLNRPPDLDLYR